MALAEFAAGFRLAHAPEAVVDHAKTVILDCLGVGVLANRFEPGRAVARFMSSGTEDGACTIWGSARSTTPRDAAFANAMLVRALEYDEGLHHSAFSLPAPFALAERNAWSGRTLLEAFIVGCEVGHVAAEVFGPPSMNGRAGSIASACAAANAMGLDAEAAGHAIGLTAGVAVAPGGNVGTMARTSGAGHAAATGLTAALLAHSGFTADGFAPERPDAADGLGRDFRLAAPIRCKRYACPSALHPGIEAMLRLRHRTGLKPGDVRAIRGDLHLVQVASDPPLPVTQARFSMAFCLSLALAKGWIAPADFRENAAVDPPIADLMSRVSDDPGSTAITVETVSGEVLSEPIAAARDLTSWPDVVAKFAECTRGVLRMSSVERVCEGVHALEHLTDVRALGADLRPAPSS